MGCGNVPNTIGLVMIDLLNSKPKIISPENGMMSTRNDAER
jgi:hypothetical protein